jgi:hypothetical protein
VLAAVLTSLRFVARKNDAYQIGVDLNNFSRLAGM